MNNKLVDLGNGLVFLQKQDAFRFGCDGVELANFVDGGPKDYAIDLGSGTGIITILLAGKRKIRTTAVEIQPELSQVCQSNIELNNLIGIADVINTPMQEISKFLKAGCANIVVCNPPYRKQGSGMKQENEAIAIARHEIKVTLSEVVDTAAYLLSTGGKFYTVNQTERLAEAMALCRAAKLEPKKLQILTPNETKKPHLFLLKCVKDGAPGLIVERERVVKVEVN
ncbi:MAG: methyltransferase [Clostridiales bacterium]|nr:methyltransferase [Clostridiales bacterium]